MISISKDFSHASICPVKCWNIILNPVPYPAPMVVTTTVLGPGKQENWETSQRKIKEISWERSGTRAFPGSHQGSGSTQQRHTEVQRKRMLNNGNIKALLGWGRGFQDVWDGPKGRTRPWRGMWLWDVCWIFLLHILEEICGIFTHLLLNAELLIRYFFLT